MTTKIKAIRTEEDYREALQLIEKLVLANPGAESEEGEKLSLLATLIHDYESKQFPESLPDPVDAILFRMEQQNLKPADLIPYIGSRSKVSEILSRKRPLTLTMIRALEGGLGIPAKVLVQESDEFRNPNDIAWHRFPLKEMEKRKYFGARVSKGVDLKMLMEDFFKPVGQPAQFFGMLRKSNYRSTRPMDKHALVVWSACVLKKADSLKGLSSFRHGAIDLSFMQRLAKLSVKSDGPIVARDLLKNNGIALVVEPHFPQTYLDGATIMRDKSQPVIGLTIRHDRLDNFWFTLMHELAHISLHFNQQASLYYDDLDNPDLSNALEREADQLAGEALVPEEKWESSPAKLIPSPIAAESLAQEIGVHTAIVAGKMRYAKRQYVYLNAIINRAKVRHLFATETWKQ